MRDNEEMNKKSIHILIAYIFNIMFIVMSLLMMRSYYDSLQIAFIVLGVFYIIYWIICSRKSYMPWSVYLNFLAGVLAQVLLNRFGIIPEDSGLFSGLGQFFYVLFVIAHATIVGGVNLILFVIAKRKAR